jgi:hypothetical protein
MFFTLSILWLPPAGNACFGDKLGIGYIKGVEGEFSAHLIAIYIKEKTGIGSVVNEFENAASVESSLKKDKTDIIIWTGNMDKLDIEKLAEEKKESSFFLLVQGGGRRVILEVSKKRLKDIKFFTLNKVMERVGGIISAADFQRLVSEVKDKKKFSKQAAREYLLEKDII